MLHSLGLHELWIQVGVGQSTCYMPLHKLAEEIGSLMCKVLPAVHFLTGSYITSKHGTKSAALKANPQLYLTEFGQDNVDVEKVEEYLVQVLKPGTLIKTMNELRFHMYHHTKKSLSDLPPTSRATRSHIQRAFYGTYIFLHCLTGSSLDAKCHGFYSDDGLIKAVKEIVLLPEDLSTICTCRVCATHRCSCRIANVPCCTYYVCQSTNTCKNPNVVLQLPIQMNKN